MVALRLLAEGGGGPNLELSWLLYAGMAFLLVTILVGWLTSSGERDQVEAAQEAPGSKRGRKEK
jgi:hypothetical protein